MTRDGDHGRRSAAAAGAAARAAPSPLQDGGHALATGGADGDQPAGHVLSPLRFPFSPSAPPLSASSFASVATIRPPVAANGCPAASDEPVDVELGPGRSRPAARPGPAAPCRTPATPRPPGWPAPARRTPRGSRRSRSPAGSARRGPAAGAPRTPGPSTAPPHRGRSPPRRSRRRRTRPAPAGGAASPTPRWRAARSTAPSVSGEELPAVMVAPRRPDRRVPNTGCSAPSFSSEVSGAGSGPGSARGRA